MENKKKKKKKIPLLVYSVGRNHTVAREEGTLLKSAILLKHFRATEINKLKQAQRQRGTFISLT